MLNDTSVRLVTTISRQPKFAQVPDASQLPRNGVDIRRRRYLTGTAFDQMRGIMSSTEEAKVTQQRKDRFERLECGHGHQMR